MERKPLLRSSSCSECDSHSHDSPFHSDSHIYSGDECPRNAEETRPRSASQTAVTSTTHGTLNKNQNDINAVPNPAAALSPSVVSSAKSIQNQKCSSRENCTGRGYHGVDDDKDDCSAGGHGGNVVDCERKEPVAGVIDANEQRKRLFLLTLIAFLMSCATMINDPVTNQYVYQVYTKQKFGNVSGGVHVNKEPCINSTNSSTDASMTKEVQDNSGNFQAHLQLVAGGIAIAVNLFLGAYSDVLGRKLLFFLPVFGHFLRDTALPVIIYFDLGLPWMYPGYVLDGLCGGYFGILVGLYAYSADITEKGAERTISVTIVAVSIGLAQCLLGVLAGLFILEAGFFWPALTSALLLFVCICLICLLPETVSREGKTCMSPLKALQNMVGTFLPHGERLRRAMLMLGLLGIFITNVPTMAGDTLDALYLMKEPFCWSSLKQGILTTSKDTSSYLATFTIIRLLAKVFCDPLLTIIGLLSEMAKCIVMALARDDLTVYMVVLAGLLRRAIYPPIRAFLSSLVPQDRQGKVFAGIAVVESVTEFVGNAGVIGIYNATENIMPGFAYFVLACCHLTSAFLFTIIWRLFRKFKASQTTNLDVQSDKGRDGNNQQRPAESTVTSY